MKPKASVPLKKIVSVSEITDDDKKKFKKLTKANDIALKIVFQKKHLVKKEYQPGQDESEDEGGDEEGDRGREMAAGGAKSRSKSKGAAPGGNALDTWYLVSESKFE